MSASDFSSLPSPALGAAEIAFNRYLGRDEHALEQCRVLAGRSLELRLSDFRLRLVFVAETHGVQLRGETENAPDVCLTGTASAFARILFAADGPGLTGGGLRIEGDVGIAQRFADLFSAVDFDIADIVDARLGPVPAYFVGRGLRGVRSLLSRAAREFPDQAAEYLREETRDVVGVWEHDRFARDVERLDEQVGRLNERLRRLQGTSRR